MNRMDLLEKALSIACEAHRGQKDRYGAPYILHSLRVMARVEDTTAKIVAILHDVVEDTDWTFEELKQEGFPTDVVEALQCVTKQEGEAYEAFVQRSARLPLARRVKLADLEDNMDVRRMPEVTQEAQARLQKYRKAWQALQGEEVK